MLDAMRMKAARREDAEGNGADPSPVASRQPESLLFRIHEAVLARMLEERGLRVDDCMVIELKSVEKLALVHVTYLRLLNLPVGLLINFGAATFKEGIRRVVNKH